MKKYSTERILLIDKIFFIFIFLIAFLPRPTVKGYIALFAPIAIALFILISINYFWLKNISIFPSNIGLNILYFLMLIILTSYTTRIIFRNESGEFEYLLGRLLSFLIIAVLIIHMNSRQLSTERIFRTIFFSVVIVGIFAIYFGITGGGQFFIFSGLDRGREFSDGFSVPFNRSQGIDRSYGEFGIFLSAAWAYFLVFRNKYSFGIRTVCGIILLLAIIVSQSRTSWLAIMIITTTYLFIKLGGQKYLLSLILATVIFLPVFTGLISTVGRELPGIEKIIGQDNIHEKNVEGRHTLDLMALNLFIKQPLKMLWGISHLEWFSVFPTNFEKLHGHSIAGLHNHFLSNLVFLGLISGLLNIMIILIPVIRLLLYYNCQEDDILLPFLSTLGLMTCLHYYEGFFSPIYSVLIATFWYVSFRNNSQTIPSKFENHRERRQLPSSRSSFSPRQNRIHS